MDNKPDAQLGTKYGEGLIIGSFLGLFILEPLNPGWSQHESACVSFDFSTFVLFHNCFAHTKLISSKSNFNQGGN